VASVLSAALATAASGAGVSVFIDAGNVAFAYRDGWWDNGHHWHAWRDRDESRWYSLHYAQNYYDWDHDRDRDEGWHDRGWHRGWYKHDRDWHGHGNGHGHGHDD
jgi:hypothetical protein